MYYKESWNWRQGEEQPDLRGQCCHIRVCNTEVCAATEGHVWVYGCTAAGICVDVSNPCYQQRA